MATFLGGDITEIVAKHPDLGDFRFATKSNESYTIDRGGFRTNDDGNQVTGNGQGIYQKNLMRWMFEGPVLIDFKNNTLDDIDKLAESSVEAVWIITHISGVVYQGKGMIVGDLQPDTNTAQMGIKIAGGGKLTKV